jgi:hypothetical protein
MGKAGILLAATLLAVVSLAFHDGGVASCGGCHVMHEGTVVPGPGAGTGALLILDNPSDICLTCHATSAGAVLGSSPLAPPAERGAGNFVFLLEDNLNDGPDGLLNPILGDAAGHSIVAPSRGLVRDRRNAVSPGGTFPADQLGCTSCHDPHGNSNFRMLNGVGPVQDGLFSFTRDAPDATGIALNGSPEGNANHTAYHGGVNDWCSNCHGAFHDTGLPGFEHPFDQQMGDTANQYNRYEGDDNPTTGDVSSSYLAAVPFEHATGSRGIRRPDRTTTSTEGPLGVSRVMCLSCHRAHASSAPYAGRWDFNVSLLQEDGVVSGSYAIPDPYGSQNQGTLCTKCHVGGPPVAPGSGLSP